MKYPIFSLYLYENSPINPYIFKKVIPIFPLYFIPSLLEALKEVEHVAVIVVFYSFKYTIILI